MNPRSGANTGPHRQADCVTAMLGLCKQAGVELIATVDGNSMTPNLSPGVRVRLRPVDPRSLQLGDVIAFAHNRRLIAHRIVGFGRTEASRPYVLTRGDAKLLIDVPVHSESIVGLVTAQRSDAAWAALQPAAPCRPKFFIAAMFAALSGRLLDVSPRGAAHFVRWAWRGWALMARLRGRPGAGAAN